MQLSNTQPQSSPVGIVSFTTTSPSRSSNFSTISCGVITILHWRYSSFNFARILYRNPIIAGSILPSVFRRDLLTVNWRTNGCDMTNLSVEYNAFDGAVFWASLCLAHSPLATYACWLVRFNYRSRGGTYQHAKKSKKFNEEKKQKKQKKQTERMLYVIGSHKLWALGDWWAAWVAPIWVGVCTVYTSNTYCFIYCTPNLSRPTCFYLPPPKAFDLDAFLRPSANQRGQAWHPPNLFCEVVPAKAWLRWCRW